MAALNKKAYAAKDYSNELSSLQQKIDKIESDYREAVKPNPYTPPEIEMPDLSVNEEYKEYDAPTDEELTKIAENEAAEYGTVGRGKIESDTSSKIKGLGAAKEEAMRQLSESLSDSDSYFESARQRSSDSALKRGLARSSTAQLTQDSLNAAQASSQSSLRGEAGRAVSKLDEEIRSAETERDSALGELDIKTAAKLTQKLNALKEEREKKAEEVTEYNNNLRERLAKLAMEQEQWKQLREEKELELREKREEEAKSTQSAAQETREQSIYKEISAYLSAMPVSDAKKQLKSNPYFASMLSPYYYSMINNALNAK